MEERIHASLFSKNHVGDDPSKKRMEYDFTLSNENKT
jgi:hypothetical protein